MMRADGPSKAEKPKFTVLNEALIKQCIYVPPSGAEEEKKSRDREQKALQKQQVDFHEVECLMFSFTGISKIDNLVGFDRLTKLQLDNNGIETICSLDHLVNLVWLDLSFNKIKRIQGLDNLTNLEDLTLHCNDIDELDNMHSLKKLRCFSIGKNQLGRDHTVENASGTHNLDGIARYLRKFRELKMLSLAGNPVQTRMVATVYESKLLAYLGGKPEEPGSGLKYLDYRLVSPQRVLEAKQEYRETLMSVEDEDKKEQEREEKEERERKEFAELRDCNCEGITTLFDVLVSDGADAKMLEAFESYDDGGADTLRNAKAEYRNAFEERVKAFREEMKKKRDAKRDEIQQFGDCLSWDQEAKDLEAKRLIKGFEKKKKRIMPAHDGHPTEEENKRIGEELDAAQAERRPSELEKLQEELRALKEELLERETDQNEAYEAVISDFHDGYKAHMEAALDTITECFKELRENLEDAYNKQVVNAFNDMRAHKQAGGAGVPDAAAVAVGVLDTSDEQDVGNKRARLESLLENKEESDKFIEESHAYRIGKLDNVEERYQKNERDTFARLHQEAKEQEHARNRARVCEINMYCALVEQLIRDQIEPDGQWSGTIDYRGTSDAFSGR
eukprot:TRINITY_DN9129_c0_g9_i1.p1 TRINITY_DN9129_c0_g9~~TRINITY_DN9129_c0_g9_i1.p1  ORF type:complete len:619 (+),score=285.38 TRINITY_DN9129_c0_g9_i1:132-1988(+)